MFVTNKKIDNEKLAYTIHSAGLSDAKQLSQIRWQMDGETENLDREQGEGYIDEEGFKDLIKKDTESPNCLFLVAEVEGKLVGFSRCEGSPLKRLAHQVEFGVGVLKDFWGYGIGKSLLTESSRWADRNDILKMTLKVLEANEKAIKLYEKLGFQVEGILKKDKYLSDGQFYNTLIMARFKEDISRL